MIFWEPFVGFTLHSLDTGPRETILGTDRWNLVLTCRGAPSYKSKNFRIHVPVPSLTIFSPGSGGTWHSDEESFGVVLKISGPVLHQLQRLLPLDPLWKEWGMENLAQGFPKEAEGLSFPLPPQQGSWLEARIVSLLLLEGKGGLSPADLEKLLVWELAGLLLTLHRTLQARNSTVENPHSSGVQRLLEHLNLNFSQEIDLEKLGRLVGWNGEYLSRTFSKELGHPITEHIHRLRIQEACHQLKTTSQSILEVSLAVGYNNISFFNRTFRRILSTSPREYRQGSSQNP